MGLGVVLVFAVEKTFNTIVHHTVKCSFTVPWATLNELLTEQRKERGPRESFRKTLQFRLAYGLSHGWP